jgi:hypothetical protein
MLWLCLVAGVLVAALAAVAAVGAALPRVHVATVRAKYRVGVEEVWALLVDVEGAAQWRDDVQSIEMLPDTAGKPVWREHSKFGTVGFVMDVCEPPTRMVTRISDEDLGFGGQWEYILTPTAEGCELAITERGFVRSPIFRFLSRYIFGYTTRIMAFQGALGRRLESAATPDSNAADD